MTGFPDFGVSDCREGCRRPFGDRFFWSFYSLWIAKLQELFIEFQELFVKSQELFVDHLSRPQPKKGYLQTFHRPRENTLCQVLPGQVRVDRLTRKPNFWTPNRKSWTFCRLRDFGHSICFFGRYSADIDCRSVLKIPEKTRRTNFQTWQKADWVWRSFFLICVEFTRRFSKNCKWVFSNRSTYHILDLAFSGLSWVSSWFWFVIWDLETVEKAAKINNRSTPFQTVLIYV